MSNIQDFFASGETAEPRRSLAPAQKALKRLLNTDREQPGITRLIGLDSSRLFLGYPRSSNIDDTNAAKLNYYHSRQ